MREIIDDKRYGALKTLGERKQAFNEVNGTQESYNSGFAVGFCYVCDSIASILDYFTCPPVAALFIFICK